MQKDNINKIDLFVLSIIIYFPSIYIILKRNFGLSESILFFQIVLMLYLFTKYIIYKDKRIVTNKTVLLESILIYLILVSMIKNFTNNIALKSFYQILSILFIIIITKFLKYENLKKILLFLAIFEFLNILIFKNLWNPNSISSRAVTLCGILLLLFPNKYIKLSIIVLTFWFVFPLGSRTATSAFLFSIIFTIFYVKLSQIFKIVFILIMFVLSYTMYLNYNEIIMRVYKSKSKISYFIIKNKNDRFINDPFNRRSHWQIAIEMIKEKPLFGHGVGGEKVNEEDFRAHNSYFTIVIQYGFLGLFIWVLFYFHTITNINKLKNNDLKNFSNFIFSYMFIAGIAESSGFGSFGAPINLIYLYSANFIGNSDFEQLT